MSRKINYKSISPFHDRLFDLMKDDIPGWAKKIGVTAGNIRDKWFKVGSYPGADKIMKIVEFSGKSANYILMGEEQNQKKLIKEPESSYNQDATIKHMLQVAAENVYLRDRVKELEKEKEWDGKTERRKASGT